MSWIAAAVVAVGAGATIYGANKQAKAVESANNTNAELQKDQNQSAWAAYLMSRGVNPNGAATGTIPSNPQAINAKFPLWATWTVPATSGTPGTSTPRRLVRRTASAGVGPVATPSPAGVAAPANTSIASSLLQ